MNVEGAGRYACCAFCSTESRDVLHSLIRDLLLSAK
jgi:hypothetical protein